MSSVVGVTLPLQTHTQSHYSARIHRGGRYGRSTQHGRHTRKRHQDNADCTTRHDARTCPGRSLRQLAASALSNQQHAAGNREESDTEKFDRSIGRVDTKSKHQECIDDHRQPSPTPGEGSALGLKARCPCPCHWRASTIAALADSAKMQIDKTGKSLEYGSGRECLMAISLALQLWWAPAPNNAASSASATLAPAMKAAGWVWDANSCKRIAPARLASAVLTHARNVRSFASEKR